MHATPVASLPFHTVLFDFDGTLVDSAACGVEATQWAFADAGLNVPDAGVIIAKMGIPIEVSFGQMASHPPDEAGYEQLMARFRAKYREVADRGMKAFDGIAPLLQALKAQGVRTAIVTSKRSDVAARNLETAGLGGLIDVLVGSDKVAHCKPAPDAVHAGLAELARLRRGGRPVDETVMDEEREGAPAAGTARTGQSAPAGVVGSLRDGEDVVGRLSQVLVVGDSSYDIDMGKAAGAATCAVTWGAHSHEELARSRPDHIVHSVPALAALLNVM
ncbi:HAD family hydrolase [Lautropia dentalis]|uniref:HAD family hydrolase n=1 Tax=Lautropia dentalis TaxID=2490857 RepID=A0A426FMR8_9BURK|nr:HAD family hydrolase [Lautropia dentalis]RRN43928.1 HAD family hydrolase [Lautropia dentalis]